MKKDKFINLSDTELSRKKLIAEINSMNKSFWKQPSFWTFLVALIATYYSWQSGIFESNSKILKYQTMELDLKKDSLNKQIEILQIQKKDIQKRNDSLTIVVNDISNEYKKAKNNFQKWKEKKQSKSDLQAEVLAFTKELKNLVNDDKIRDENASIKFEKNKNWEEYTNSLVRNTLIKQYDANYKTQAIIFREKLNYYLPNINLDRNTLFDYQYPTNRLGIEFVIDNLEYLAFKLTP